MSFAFVASASNAVPTIKSKFSDKNERNYLKIVRTKLPELYVSVGQGCNCICVGVGSTKAEADANLEEAIRTSCLY